MFSRSARIWTLLVIDSAFLLVELVVGYSVGSLALVADAFHMLNDVLSLIVALYAIKVSANSPTAKYSYGWHRAEILAALINGVFLLALCLSIFLEAIVRFFSTPEISNPKLVVIVGSLGLASNVLGLFLFQEHGHGHGHEHGSSSDKHNGEGHKGITDSPLPTETTPLIDSSSSPERPASPRPIRPDSPSSMYGHPAQTRAHVVQAAEQAGYFRNSQSAGVIHSPRGRSASNNMLSDMIWDSSFERQPSGDQSVVVDINEPDGDSTNSKKKKKHSHSVTRRTGGDRATSIDIEQGHTAEEHGTQSHSHSHSSMNMHALLLHVLGDALGNVGVIASGLIIWLTTWPGRFYSDPIISLVITAIIFGSALPLVKSASFILLQGVPTSIELDALREDIRRVHGVLSVHELHVWQLSEAKIVASVHVWVAKDVDYMGVASEIRMVLHRYNVHSCTIQPEFTAGIDSDGHSEVSDDTHCGIPCAPGSDCPREAQCCPPRGE